MYSNNPKRLTIFSLFPLLLVLIVFGSTVIESQIAQKQILEWVRDFIPFAGEIIEENIKQVLHLRGSFGLIGTLTLAWGATGVFSTIVRNVNRAWKDTEEQNFIKMRLYSLLLIGGLAIFISLLLLLNPILGLLTRNISALTQWKVPLSWITELVTWLLLVGGMILLYFWIPRKKIKWQAAVIGGMFSATVIELVTYLFTFSLRTGLAKYNLVYGSLGAMMALIFWIYLMGTIVLFGAHLTATLDDGQADVGQRGLSEAGELDEW